MSEFSWSLSVILRKEEIKQVFFFFLQELSLPGKNVSFDFHILFLWRQISRYNTPWLVINGLYINYAFRKNERQKHQASLLLVRGNCFTVWHWRQDSQCNFIEITSSHILIPPCLSESFVLYRGKSHRMRNNCGATSIFWWRIILIHKPCLKFSSLDLGFFSFVKWEQI